MRDRKGSWVDLLSSHTLAVDAKKIWLGFLATAATIAIFILFSLFYGRYGAKADPSELCNLLIEGRCPELAGYVLPLFNPFAAGWIHYVLSAAFYLLLFAVWAYCGGAITRLTALQYARDDIPTLNEALGMVRAKKKAFFFAPVTPLIGVLIFGLCNQIAGLIGSIPLVGPWIMAILIPVGVLPGTIILTFIAVLGILSFGLMLPSISIGGKDAFEGWSSAYSYILWGFNRFIVYSVIALVIGVVSVLAASFLAQLFIALMNSTLSLGLIEHQILQTAPGGGLLRTAVYPVTDADIGIQAASWVAFIIALLIRLLVPAFAFSYFFTSNTIICFLMRKHVDRVDIDEVYIEEEPLEEAEDIESESHETGADEEADLEKQEETAETGEEEGGGEEPSEADTEETETKDEEAEDEAGDSSEDVSEPQEPEQDIKKDNGKESS